MKTFKEFLKLTEKAVEELFQQKVNYYQPDYKSRDIVIPMDISLFLKLSTELKKPESDKMENIKSVLDKGNKLETIPTLFTEPTEDGDELKVEAHEGRHRALTLQSMGYNTMPVKIHDSSIRWSEQTDEDSYDYRKTFPEYIIPQDGGNKIKFPLKREQIK